MKSTIKKQTVLFIFSLFTATISFAQWNSERGNGNTTTVTRTTSDYDVIKCSGSMDFVLVSGKEGNITIEAEENLIDYIITEVRNNDLVVKVENGKNLKPSRGNTIKITIPFEDISKVSLAGSGDLYSKNTINSENFNVSLSGSGDVNLDLNCSWVKGAVAGSGDLKLTGSTNKLVAKIAGSGDFHGFDLKSNETDVAVAGSGDAKVVSNESIKARVAGSGDIVYKGKPQKEDNKVAGSGSIKSM